MNSGRNEIDEGLWVGRRMKGINPLSYRGINYNNNE